MNLHPEKSIHPELVQSGGFIDTIVIEMADFGVDVLISSDHNFVVETIARELGMTQVEFDHYISERYGLYFMQRILGAAFPGIPVTILENI
jgi:putative NIF3 family GTP cyclohydrolase 1 type 2